MHFLILFSFLLESFSFPAILSYFKDILSDPVGTIGLAYSSRSEGSFLYLFPQSFLSLGEGDRDFPL